MKRAPKEIVLPIPPQCASYFPMRCPETATYALIHPDGTQNPGGFHCEAHARAICTEILEKCNERWTLAPILRWPSSAERRAS